MADDYSPRWVGDLSHPLQHTFVDGAGLPHDLTGVVAANMTFVLVSVTSGTRKVGLGTWTITDAPNGVAVYHWNVADVNTAGLWQIQASVPFADGTFHFSIKELVFLQPL